MKVSLKTDFNDNVTWIQWYSGCSHSLTNGTVTAIYLAVTVLIFCLFLVKGLINQQFRKRKKIVPLLYSSCLIIQFTFLLPFLQNLGFLLLLWLSSPSSSNTYKKNDEIISTVKKIMAVSANENKLLWSSFSGIGFFLNDISFPFVSVVFA